jgi:hypothetical protein
MPSVHHRNSSPPDGHATGLSNSLTVSRPQLGKSKSEKHTAIEFGAKPLAMERQPALRFQPGAEYWANGDC